nr:SIS domain-containing protein [Vibrio sp. S12_S33]
MPKIRMMMPSLTKTERSIAEHFLNNRSITKETTISQISAELDVSNALVVKVCKKIGYDGFKELKTALIVSHCESRLFTQTLEPTDDCAQIVQKVLNNSLGALQEALSFSSVPSIEQAARVLLGAKRITIMAVGGTSIIAEDFHHKLLRIGIHTQVPKDYHMMIMSASLMTEEDAVLMISHSGQTVDLLDAAREVKKAGAKLITVTNNFTAEMTQISDLAIFAPASPEPILGKNGTARLIKLALIDCLYATIVNMSKEKSISSIKKTMNATAKLHR